MANIFTQVRVQGIYGFIIFHPFVQTVDTISVPEVMHPGFIAFGNGCFWKRIPELMEPNIQYGFIIKTTCLVREKGFPAWKCNTDNTFISAQEIQHVLADIDDSGFPAFGFPDVDFP
ncbi:hypothetical protein [Proteiniclasticum sp. QWL-01]|uniref:hypothetical protein n=1 Tax=Proteiniclasticum sp. QWL-01 TaxID=3036945 RepID=UPI00240F877E|nr:hypothetical protein [Proteiniclasticum sp. QWL-01]WFF72089.1 hypothetical protein P6M73_12380 [Proteiniclasticum sp. QWL-01]